MFFGDHISFRRYQAKTVALACIEMSAGGASPHHRHPDEQIVMLVEGRLEAKYGEAGDEKKFELGPGDIFTVPPLVLHQIRALEDSVFFEAFGPAMSPSSSKEGALTSNSPDVESSVRVSFIDHAGVEQEVVAMTGETLMQVARRHEINEILAACGGNCACGTCQIYLDEADMQRLGIPASKESSMLSLLENATATSRLSCQIEVTPDLNGLRVRMPEKQLRATRVRKS